MIDPVAEVKLLPKIQRDFTLEELRRFDGTGPDGRALVAVGGLVFDVTRNRIFGPGGPYGAFGGRDLTRLLAKHYSEEYDLSDLTSVELKYLNEWELKFMEECDIVGIVLPTNYSKADPGTSFLWNFLLVAVPLCLCVYFLKK